MLSLLTPDNLPGVLTAIGAILSALAGVTLWKARAEPAKPGTLDALLLAIAENTASNKAIGGQFGQNLTEFKDANAGIDQLIGVMREQLSEIRAMREHLSAIRGAGR